MKNIRLAQIFTVNNQYIPSKASLYLKRSGVNINKYWDITENEAVIDATNFIDIHQEERKLIYDDNAFGSQCNGAMDLESSIYGGAYPYLIYPILTEEPSGYKLFIRGESSPSDNFVADILLDGIRVDSIFASSINGWNWYEARFVLPDNKTHNLGIQLKEDGCKLDNIYITPSGDMPSGNGPSLTESPFLTIHFQIYNVNESLEPTSKLTLYEYKNTVEEVKHDDWYNFPIRPFFKHVPLDWSNENYALVLTATGGTDANYVIWEIVDSDEYAISPSAFMVRDA